MNGRTSGILLHPTSLPGPYGIGELGPEARAFLDFLRETRQGLWQILPLGPTGYGDSPYQCFSAFAGNPLLVSLDLLKKDGLLSASDLAKKPAFTDDKVDYDAVKTFKQPLLQKALATFEKTAGAPDRDDFEGFRRGQAAWLDDYALFMALKAANGGRSWNTWERAIVDREPHALRNARDEHARTVREVAFAQFLFFAQWRALRAYAHQRGIRIMGDIPIFVSHDSADVWAHPELFYLAADGSPAYIAGVPPDYFSATGQRWGNPLYRWDVLARTGYAWWIERFRAILHAVDVVRLDHFRGFEAYWEIPGEEPTAVKGRWVKGPGAALFEALENALGKLPIVAENLGVITAQVEALRERFGWPGMAILQFAFGTDSQASDFIPHNYPRNRVVYTGTHDNDTVLGWWTGGVGDSTRTGEEVKREHELVRTYMGGDGCEIHWDFIRTLLTSVANVAIVPIQDVLGLGTEARMNLPGRLGGNWGFRYRAEQLTPDLRKRLRALTEASGRAAAPPETEEATWKSRA
jgi:4-alpha-glucanotransferase